MKKFELIDPKQDFIALEHKIIRFWEKNKILDKYLAKNQKSAKKWSFLDGPITANNPMGVHHAWGRTLKDLWQRFYTMQGFKQRYQNGFDCQGLWVEVEVEKELGFKNKKDIENYGIDKFVEKCKERVLKYSKIQTKQSVRLAEWMDWDNSYYTMSDENNYTIWHFLKVCHENGWIYQGTDSVPWCPRCATAISQHEILTEEYQEVTHDSIFFTLPIIDGKFKDHYLLVWTTTPWTIPANVAVAVDPKKEYAIVEDKGKKMILISSRVAKIFANKIKPSKIIKGKDLIGAKYNAPFSNLSGIKENLGNYQYKVVESDELILPVSSDEGTGLVHIAPGAGSEDFRLGQKYNLPILNVIDQEANYLDYMDDFAGKNAKTNPKIIFDYLTQKDGGKYLLKIEPYRHRYPTCWRCKTELVWRNVAEWYIAMDQPSKLKTKTFRQRMIEVAKKINWIPKWGLDRELDWLNNMHDWLISKKRYWGLALPIWQCKCGNFEVIGSKEELKDKTIKGWEEFKNHSPHKPWIDEIQIKCPKCQEAMQRIPDVGNPWLDAGIVPFSTYIDPDTKKVSYLSDKKYWRDWFPADFVTEAFPGQFKNWFYSLIAMSTALEDTNPYKNLLGHALVFDEHGHEMHKSKGNAIWFDDAVDIMGVDVMRWMYSKQNPVQNLNFGYTPAKEVLRGFVLPLWNSYSFFVTYANIDNWTPKNNSTVDYDSLSLLDKWILSKLEELIGKVTLHLEKFESVKGAQTIELFIKDLSTWYVRNSRKRRDSAFYQTIYKVFYTLSLILAPFIPHISEAIYQNLRLSSDPESIHLCDWPKLDKKMLDKNILEKMEKARLIVETAHALRREAKIKVRQPLQELRIKEKGLSKELLEIIAQEINVKKVIFDEKNKSEVTLDTLITPELKKEGLLRELTRQIQFLRKLAGFKALDQIELYWQTDSSDIKNIFAESEKEIKKSTISSSLHQAKPAEAKIGKDFLVGGEKVYLGIK